MSYSVNELCVERDDSSSRDRTREVHATFAVRFAGIFFFSAETLSVTFTRANIACKIARNENWHRL